MSYIVTGERIIDCIFLRKVLELGSYHIKYLIPFLDQVTAYASSLIQERSIKIWRVIGYRIRDRRRIVAHPSTRTKGYIRSYRELYSVRIQNFSPASKCTTISLFTRQIYEDHEQKLTVSSFSTFIAQNENIFCDIFFHLKGRVRYVRNIKWETICNAAVLMVHAITESRWLLPSSIYILWQVYFRFPSFFLKLCLLHNALHNGTQFLRFYNY